MTSLNAGSLSLRCHPLMKEPTSSPDRTSPRATVPAALSIAIVAVVPLYLIGPFELEATEFPFPNVARAIAVVTWAMTFGTFVSLFISNRRRLLSVFRPNLGRVISALLMTPITPVEVFYWWPYTLVLAATDPDFPNAARLVPVLVAVWYGIACLIISGVRERLWRPFLFALAYWAMYAAALFGLFPLY